MALLTLKEVVLDLKHKVFGNVDVNIENYIENLSYKSRLSKDELINFHNLIELWYTAEQNPSYTMTKRKDWSDAEVQLLFLYYEHLTKETIVKRGKVKSKKVNEMCDELSDILVGRTKQSISFKYYQMKTKEEKDNQIDINEELELTFLNSSQKEVDLTVFDEVEPINNTINEPVVIEQPQKKEEVDIINVLSDLVGNLETVGLNINPFFISLLEMSQKAVQNSNIEKIEQLEKRMADTHIELENEKQKNVQLQKDYMNLLNDFLLIKNEIDNFDGLSSKDKLKQMHQFVNNLKDKSKQFGGVMSMTI